MSHKASIELQKNIKDNSEEVQDFIADLHRWEKDIKNKEEQIISSPESPPQDLPPVRNKRTEDSTKKIVTDNKRRKDEEKTNKKERISSYDYAAWDKFDVDKALDSASSEEEEVTQETPKAKNATSGTGEPSNLNKKERATKLKDEGNKCYSSGRLDNAIAKYTQGMALDPTNAILPANRAMAYIKMEKYEAAELDCSRCLKLDASYIKAYLRRGTSRLKLQKLTLAAADFRKVLELEPWNKDAKKELEKLGSGTAEKQVDLLNTVASKEGISQCGESNSQNKTKEKLEKDSAEHNSKKKNKVGSESSKKNHGKKITITEVDSSLSQTTTVAGEDANVVTPITKLPHERSQKPLKKILVTDVPSEDLIPKCICSAKNVKHSEAKENSVVSKSPAKATVPKQKTQKPAVQVPAVPTVPAVPAVPRTSHQFSQDWQKLAHHHPLAVEYLKKIPPTFFRNVDLETELLVDLMSALKWDDFTPQESLSYLSSLAQSDGFSVNIMFLDSSQKKVINEVLEKCKEENSQMDLLEKITASIS